MALKATIFKVKLSLSNLDIHFYDDFSLTIARHPSENNLRMMARLLAFSLNAQEENLAFTKGLSDDTEADIWKINHDGSIDHWIELGHLDERRIRQACSRAKKVSLYSYQGNHSLQWFESIKNGLGRFKNLSITHFDFSKNESSDSIEDFVERGVNLSCNIEDDEIWISNENNRLLIELNRLLKT